MRLKHIFIAFGAAFASAAASAAELPSSRIKERLQPAAERAKPAAIEDAAPPESVSPAADAVLAAPREIVLQGAVAISADAFESLFLRYRNRGLTRAELSKLAREVTDIYRGQGYFLSRAVIPPQTIAGGTLIVRVEEGRFTSVDFGSVAPGGLSDYFAALLTEIPARRSTLERAILTAGDLAGVTIRSSRTVPVPNSPGQYTLVLDVHRKAADGYLYLDNRGEGGGDALQLSAQMGVNDVGVEGGRIEVSVFTDPGDPSRRQYAEVTASAPIGLRGTIVAISASASNSVEGAHGSGRYKSPGTEVAVSVRHPVLRSRANSFWVNLDVAQSNSDASIEEFGLRRDELALARLGAEWDNRDGWGGRNRVNLGVTFGRDGFRAPSPVHPMARNDDGTSFTKFTLAASRTQTISPQWSLHAALRGQYSAENLPDDEEISFGGARWGRAYDYGEIEGDTGAAAQLELRYTRDKIWLVQSLQAYAFGDAAATWIRDGEGVPDTLSSAGMGLRATFGDGYRAGFEAAVPLDRLPDGKDKRHPRMFATFAREF